MIMDIGPVMCLLKILLFVSTLLLIEVSPEKNQTVILFMKWPLWLCPRS